MIRRAAHRVAYWLLCCALAAAFVPAACLLPAAGDYLVAAMWWHEVRS